MKRILLLLIILLIIIGCGSLPQKGVVDNVVYSTSPKLVLKVDPDFTLIDTTDKWKPEKRKVDSRLISPSSSRDYFTFAKVDGTIIEKLITIQISTTDSYWAKGFPQKIKDKSLEFGNENVEQIHLEYITHPVWPSRKYWLAKRIMDLGFLMPCGLIKISHGTVGSSFHLLSITYYENVSGFGNNCRYWKSKTTLTTEQQDYLESFNKRSKSCIVKLNYESNIATFLDKQQGAAVSREASVSVQFRYIEIMEDDIIREYGKPKFEVLPGDKLVILQSKICRGGSGICYKVKNIKTGEIGYVTAKRMKERHKIHNQEKSSNKNDAKAKQDLASIPKDVSVARVSLRKGPIKISSEIKIKTMLVEYGFFDMSRNSPGSFDNAFVDNKDGTITDKATGLMWQKSGSSRSLENSGAKRYIKQLNKKRFAGHSDWRLPTVEELASLLKQAKTNGVHIDSVFDKRQIRCWTIDRCEPSYYYLSGAWLVDYERATFLEAMYGKSRNLSGPGTKNTTNYVKAVRSVNY